MLGKMSSSAADPKTSKLDEINAKSNEVDDDEPDDW